MDNSKQATLELGTKPVGHLLMQYALPAIAAMTAASLYNMTDSIFIGQGCGPLAISGLAITFPLQNLGAAFGAGVGVGASTCISVKLGQKDYNTAERVFGNAVTLNIIIGIAFSVITLLFLNPILLFFGASEATLPYAREYMVRTLAGNAISHMFFGMNAILRAASKPRSAMMASIMTVILNAILKCDAPIPVPEATEKQRFFGRYLLFFVLSQVQTLITMLGNLLILGVDCVHPGLLLLSGFVTSTACSMLAYAFAVAFGNIGRALIVVILIIQIAGSGGSYPIELLPNFFQQVYLFFPFPYAINAMREAIAGLYQNQYLIYLLQLMLFFVVGLLIGIFAKRSLGGINKYMNEQLDKTEMM